MGVTTELTLARHVVSRWRRRLDVAQIALWGVTWLVLAFLIAPIAIIVLTSLTSTPTVEFPPQGFSLVWYQRFIATLQGAPGTRPALARSIWFSTHMSNGVVVVPSSL